MANVDPEQEQLRLAGLYTKMEDGELLKLAEDWQQLSEPAREALLDEAEKRNLELPVIGEHTDPEPNDLVMLHRFRDLPEAMMAKGALESAGITCFLMDENMVRLDWFLSNLLGGAKLFVHQADSDAALEILNQEAPSSFDVDGVGNYERPQCPQCGSLDIGFEELNKPVSSLTAYAGLPLPIHRTRWICRS